jgi:hypothetical protein
MKKCLGILCQSPPRWFRLETHRGKDAASATDKGYPALFVNWAAGCVMVLCVLFGIGKLLFVGVPQGLAYFAARDGSGRRHLFQYVKNEF